MIHSKARMMLELKPTEGEGQGESNCVSATTPTNEVEENGPTGSEETTEDGKSEANNTARQCVEVPPEVAPTATSSSSSVICRICQLSEKDTGVALESTGCGCRGSVDRCHRPCLEEWVRTRSSVQCEICNETFTHLDENVFTATPPSNNIFTPRMRMLQQIQDDAPPPQVICSDSRRMWFGVIIFMLVFSVCATTSLAMYLKKDYKRAWNEEAAKPAPDFDAVADKYNFCITIVIGILSFCGTLTVGVLILWVFAEWWVWPRQERLSHMWHMLHQHRIGLELQRMRNARQREQNHGNGEDAQQNVREAQSNAREAQNDRETQNATETQSEADLNLDDNNNRLPPISDYHLFESLFSRTNEDIYSEVS